MGTLYSYDRYSQTTTTTPFKATNSNWFISATKPNENIYFPNLSSYNNWAKSCCSDSYNSITSGSHNGYNINFNRF